MAAANKSACIELPLNLRPSEKTQREMLVFLDVFGVVCDPEDTAAVGRVSLHGAVTLPKLSGYCGKRQQSRCALLKQQAGQTGGSEQAQ